MRHDITFTGEISNEKTSIASLGPPAAPLGPRPSFLAAFDRLCALAEAAAGPALAVAAVDTRARVVDASLVPDRGALIIGRHTSCGLRLEHDAVALRQIAILARAEGESLRAHVWDLNTGAPFSTENAERVSALVADGPVYVATGEYALWIVPVALLQRLPDRAKEAWDSLPPRRTLDRRDADSPPPAWEWTAPVPERGKLVDEVTHVTMCAAPLLLGDGAEPEVGWGCVRLQSGSEKVRRQISAERLERGVLVGRYARCGLTIGGLDRVSRVHLLLVRIGEEVWAIDTASTHGTERRGQRISAVVLEPRDDLLLADILSFGWTREEHPEA
jgi:hypothetical protein